MACLTILKFQQKIWKPPLPQFFFLQNSKVLAISAWVPVRARFYDILTIKSLFLLIFRSVLVVDFIVLMIDFICLEKENDLKVRRVPYCDTNTCVSLKSRTVPYFCWYCEESLFKQLSLICVLATFFYIFWEMMLISLFKKNLGWLFWIQLRQGFDQQHFLSELNWCAEKMAIICLCEK